MLLQACVNELIDQVLAGTAARSGSKPGGVMLAAIIVPVLAAGAC
jgi:hypothetical protein